MLPKNSLLKNKIPGYSSFNNNEDAYNYMVKVLNSSKEQDLVMLPQKRREDLPYSFATAGGVINAMVTFPHSLGVVPSSFFVSDFYITSTVLNNMYSVSRLGWTSTDATFLIRIVCSGTFSGNLKITIEE